MNDEILKLAKKCGIPDADIDSLNEHHPDALEAFYRATFNAGLDAAVKELEKYQIPVGNSRSGELACEWTYAALKEIRDAIRALKEKP